MTSQKKMGWKKDVRLTISIESWLGIKSSELVASENSEETTPGNDLQLQMLRKNTQGTYFKIGYRISISMEL